jgi:HSP20 family protein
MRNRYGVPALRSAFDFLDDFNKSFFGSGDFSYGLMSDVKEDDEKYTIRAEVPGLPKENIDIQYKEGVLAVTADWSKETNEEGVRTLRQKRYCFSEYLPDINPEDIQAGLRDGVLTVTAPKREEVKPKQIDIKVE